MILFLIIFEFMMWIRIFIDASNIKFIAISLKSLREKSISHRKC